MFGVAERPGATDLHRHLEPFERGGVARQLFLDARQHQKVVRPAPAGSHLGPDVGRNPRGILARDVATVDRVIMQQYAHAGGRCLIVTDRFESVELGLFRCRRIWEDVAEDAVHPFAQCRHGPERRLQWHGLPAGLFDDPPDPVVDLDVGSTEPEDRLLRIAHDEQRPRPRPNPRPVSLADRLLLTPNS